MMGKGMGKSPRMTCRSLWQTPAAFMRTNTSPSAGGKTSTSSMTRGFPNS
jgi:hypothetical protein